MLNFKHAPSNTDGQYATKIASRIKEKMLEENNELSFLLFKQLGKSGTPRVEFGEITDFPRLEKLTIRNKITFGPYQINVGKSYIADLITVYFFTEQFKDSILNNDLYEKFKDCKIIATLLKSRHHRGANSEYYKVFVVYLPYVNKSKAIKGKYI